MSFLFGDVVKLRFYTAHHHVHHALYGLILYPISWVTLNPWIAGAAYGMLLSEAKFFVTKRLEGHRFGRKTKK